jgi:hypothetical protein
MFDFFRAWLMVVGLGMAVVGVAMSLVAGTRVFQVIDRLIDPAFWKASPDAPTRQFQAWSYAVTGAVMAGWGLTVAILAWQAFPGRQAWAWWAIAAGAGLWFVLDTSQSLRHRVFTNAAINVAVLTAVAVPLIATLGEFH